MLPYQLLCVGAFEDEDVTHVEGDVNPVRDLEIISEELRLKDMEYLRKRLVGVLCTCSYLKYLPVQKVGEPGISPP